MTAIFHQQLTMVLNKVIIFLLESIELMVKGINCLKENSKLLKMYRGLKEFRDWLLL